MFTAGTLYGLARRELSADRALFGSFVAAALVYAGAHATTSLAAGYLAKALVVVEPSPRGWGPVSLTLVGLLSGLVKGAAGVWTATSKTRMAHRVGAAVRLRIAKRLLARGAVSPAPEVVARTALGIREVERGVEGGVLALAQAAAQLFPLVAILVTLSPPLALGAAVMLVPFGIGVAAARRAWRRWQLSATHVAERIHQEVDELVRHVDLFRVYGAAPKLEAELVRLSDLAERSSVKAEGGRVALSAANEVLAAAGLLVVLAVAPRMGLVLSGETLVPFAAVLFMMYRPLRDLGDARSTMWRGTIALEALEELAAADRDDSSPARQRGFGLARLVVEGLGASRGGERTSFVAEPGEIVAVVGPTGSGKTTLLRALLGLETEVVGTIRYGGEDLTDATVGPTSRPFAWVPQDAPIFSGTLSENVLLGRGEPADAHAALRAIGAERLLDECGNELIGPSGRPVSGGERRLVGLARALVLGAPVLLLDEPTEGLDSASEARVIDALERLRGHRTIILVTHRKAPLRIADRVIELGASPPPISEPRTSSLRR